MSESIWHGGPAFPMGYHPEGNSADQFGMTLRDYFAAKAIEALIIRGWGLENASVKAFEIADAMLKAREAKP